MPKWSVWTAGAFAVLVALVVLEVFFNWIPSDRQEIRTDVFRKFDNVAVYVKGKDNVYARSYQMASAVSFRNKEMFYKLRGMNRVDVFDFWPQSNPVKNEFDVILRKNEKFKKHVRKIYEVLSREGLDDQFDVARVRRR
jgi:hypothetical protein